MSCNKYNRLEESGEIFYVFEYGLDIHELSHTNLGAPSATKTRKDLFFSLAAQRNSITVPELPKVSITSLQIINKIKHSVINLLTNQFM